MSSTRSSQKLSKNEFSGREEYVQAHPCSQRRFLPEYLKTLPRCFACETKRKCCFQGFRRVTRIGQEYKLAMSFPAGVTAPDFPRLFSRMFSGSDVEVKMRTCARILYPRLVAEKAHRDSAELVYRPRELDYRVICDVCSTSLFDRTWMCTLCGRELCPGCFDDMNSGHSVANVCSKDEFRKHTASSFVPVSRFEQKELDDAICDMGNILQQAGSQTVPLGQRDAPESVPRMRVDACSEACFQSYLSQGIPMVISGVNADMGMQGGWTPSGFIQRYGDKKVVVVNSESGKTRSSTVKVFFEQFGQQKESNEIWKLKDWPPQKAFKQTFPEYFDSFDLSVPFGNYTRCNGIFNLASHFPFNGLAPDLGPKMYNAYASIQDDMHHGSTRLHMDITDAVNIMPFAANTSTGTPGTALWHIFLAEHASTLREYMRNELGLDGPADPIHSQQTYLKPSDLQRLQNKYGIRPYTIHQEVGDAIIIPAGCPHQVSNQADAIKVACDFVSQERIATTERLIEELRKQRMAQSGDDVLQLYTVLWYAWCNLSQLRKDVADLKIGEIAMPDMATDIGGSAATAAPSTELPGSICMEDTSTDSAAMAAMSVELPETSHTEDMQAANGICAIKLPGKNAAKNRALKVARATSHIQKKASFDRPCPVGTCNRRLKGNNGVLDHLQSTHAAVVRYNDTQRKNLLKLKRAEFEAVIWQYLDDI